MDDDDACPCDPGMTYMQCCGPLLSGRKMAITTEQLMRSRYTVFVLRDETYLRKTWHPDTCPGTIHLDENAQWLGLKIRAEQAGGVSDEEGVVEFVARYKVAGRGHRLHEISRFTRCDGHWCYVDGEHKN